MELFWSFYFFIFWTWYFPLLLVRKKIQNKFQFELTIRSRDLFWIHFRITKSWGQDTKRTYRTAPGVISHCPYHSPRHGHQRKLCTWTDECAVLAVAVFHNVTIKLYNSTGPFFNSSVMFEWGILWCSITCFITIGIYKKKTYPVRKILSW